MPDMSTLYTAAKKYAAEANDAAKLAPGLITEERGTDVAAASAYAMQAEMLADAERELRDAAREVTGAREMRDSLTTIHAIMFATDRSWATPDQLALLERLRFELTDCKVFGALALDETAAADDE